MTALLKLELYRLIVRMRTTWKSPKVSVYTIGLWHLHSTNEALESKELELRSRCPHLAQYARPVKPHPILPGPKPTTQVWAARPLAHLRLGCSWSSRHALVLQRSH